MNRPGGFEILMAFWVVDRFTISDVKFGEPHGGLHKNITIDDITPSCLDLMLRKQDYGRSNFVGRLSDHLNCNIYNPLVETQRRKKLISENSETMVEHLDRRQRTKHSNRTGRGWRRK